MIIEIEGRFYKVAKLFSKLLDNAQRAAIRHVERHGRRFDYLLPDTKYLAACRIVLPRQYTYGNHRVGFSFLVVATRGVFYATTND
jgi:hypothetical protein